MKILKFTLSGEKATFTRPYFNSYFSTYSHIHKVALLGILGAVIGIEREKDKSGILKFYNELENLKVSIVPSKAQFLEVRNTITETTGMLNKGFTYVAEYMELIKPSWDIYIEGNNNKHFDKIIEYVLGKKSIYHIFLGKNHHFASIDNAELLEGVPVSKVDRLHSLFPAGEIETEEDDEEYERIYFKEHLPVAMDRVLNQYLVKPLVLTNEDVVSCNSYDNIINCEGRNLYLI